MRTGKDENNCAKAVLKNIFISLVDEVEYPAISQFKIAVLLLVSHDKIGALVVGSVNPAPVTCPTNPVNASDN